MYTVSIGCQELRNEVGQIREFATFPEAFVAFLAEIRKLVDQGTSYQLLETGCWLEQKRSATGAERKAMFGWYAARDFAYENGVVTGQNCEVADPLPVVSDDAVYAAMVSSMTTGVLNDLRDTMSAMDRSLAAVGQFAEDTDSLPDDEPEDRD